MALRKRHGHSSAAVRLARAIAIHAIASAAGLAVWKAVHATSLRNGLTSTGAAIAAWLAARYARKAVRKTARKTMRGKHGRRTLAADGQGTACRRKKMDEYYHWQVRGCATSTKSLDYQIED